MTTSDYGYDGPERRRSNGHLLERMWRNVVPLLALGVALYAVVQVEQDSDAVAERSERTARFAAVTSTLAAENSARIDDISALARKVRRETRRRDELDCRQDEQRHLDDVTRLRRTYQYLRRLPAEEKASNLTKEVVRSLPATERAARVDIAPKYCDRPGVGLPEPDPFIPRRQSFRYLLSP